MSKKGITRQAKEKVSFYDRESFDSLMKWILFLKH